MGPGERRARFNSSTSNRDPMPRPASVNSSPRDAQSLTGLGMPRHDSGEGPHHTGEPSPPSPLPSRPRRRGPPKRRLCASTARAAEVQVARGAGSPTPASAAAEAWLPEAVAGVVAWRFGADLDSSRTGHSPQAASSAPRSAALRMRPATGATVLMSLPSRTSDLTTLGAALGRSHSGGARGVRCIARSPVQPTPCRFWWPSCRSARDFSVLFATRGPLDIAAAAAAAAAERGDSRVEPS
mmetsp:Transcript_63501/g.196561  ORF Transcript_63501/g.196561 Transcript_63501/m.196561 type:complete len:240 (+) Transcript_63501:337-1056(+)